MVAQLSCHREPRNQTWLSRLCLNPILGSWELAAPVIFGEEAELAHVWVLLWLSRVDRLILASSIYPKEELQQCQPAAPGSSSLFTQLLEFLLGAQGLQGHCPGLLLCFPCPPHLGN